MSTLTPVKPTVSEEAVGSCRDYATLFSSPYLDKFDEEDFREMQIAQIIQDNANYDVEDDLSEEDTKKVSQRVKLAREEHEDYQPRMVVAAKDICNRCPVLAECKTGAMKIKPEEIYGVMAAMTQSERVSAQASARRAAARALRAQKNIDVETTRALTQTDVRRVTERLLAR